MVKLLDQMLEIIQQEYPLEQQEFVQKELLTIELKHVMANSEYNLNNTRYAVLHLAKGDVEEVIKLTEAAKIDFRDVIMWAMEES